MNRTILLALIAVAALLLELFPERAGAIKFGVVGLGALYLSVRVLRSYPQKLGRRRRAAAQTTADDAEYSRYAAELAALRATHDPDGKYIGESDAPSDYCDALLALHAKYQVMLDRKFGAH